MILRIFVMLVLCSALCIGGGCGNVTPTGDGDDGGTIPGGTDDGIGGDDGGTDDGTTGGDDGGTTNPGQTVVTPCYEGSLTCTTGPVAVDCGTWQFTIADDDSITGTARITGYNGGSLNTTLTGTFNTLNDVNIIVNAANADGGTMELQIEAGTLNVTGTWISTDGTEPVGETLAGDADGGFCN